jgi:uncharacterized protein DUF3560
MAQSDTNPADGDEQQAQPVSDRMTRRERKERRQERREEWAEKREASASAAFDQAHTMAAAIPFGQPILVGHHSEKRDRKYRARIDGAMGHGVADSRMAEHHANRAAGIARQLDTSVFSDDVDAIDRLRERIAEREDRRDRIKAYNASCRKGTPNPSVLTERERDKLASTRRVAAYQLSKGGGFPSYVLTNLGAAIRKDQKRIADIERRANQTAEAEDNGGVVVRCTGDYCAVTFAEKPERAILDTLKASGFRWSGGSWHGRVDALPAGLRQ